MLLIPVANLPLESTIPAANLPPVSTTPAANLPPVTKAVNETMLIRERESRTRIGSDATFFWDSCSNLDIDDNFRISHNLGLGLATNISTELAIQPDRDREIEII